MRRISVGPVLVEEVVGIGALTDFVPDLVEHCTVDRVEDPKVAVRVTAETPDRRKERQNRNNMVILSKLLCDTSAKV